MSIDTLLSYIVTYGVWVVGIVAFLSTLGIPMPSTFFIIACGAFVEQQVLEPFSTLLIALVFVVLGDLTGYAIGYWLEHILPAKVRNSLAWRKGEEYFQQKGGSAIFLTRWLITPIAFPVNLLAGTSRYRLAHFAMLDTAGELLWLLIYGTIGYIFGTQWEAVSELIHNLGGMGIGILLIIGGGYWLFVRWRKAKKKRNA